MLLCAKGLGECTESRERSAEGKSCGATNVVHGNNGSTGKTYSRGLLIGILFSELRDGTSYHFGHMGLHKKVSVVEDVDNKLL
ncbi:hypothetical protein Acr_00g0033100 [Actinidia rufa]|uniref:Uncharacterized protein n=1 Tax=Actinidia rufa TaxID=165716 RepID=A0A7J0DFR8_9ERIC|nr:hypothetical protein Acr_00g0033100 [Actinidia rufa]